MLFYKSGRVCFLGNRSASERSYQHYYWQRICPYNILYAMTLKKQVMLFQFNLALQKLHFKFGFAMRCHSMNVIAWPVPLCGFSLFCFYVWHLNNHRGKIPYSYEGRNWNGPNANYQCMLTASFHWQGKKYLFKHSNAFIACWMIPVTFKEISQNLSSPLSFLLKLSTYMATESIVQITLIQGRKFICMSFW